MIVYGWQDTELNQYAKNKAHERKKRQIASKLKCSPLAYIQCATCFICTNTIDISTWPYRKSGPHYWIQFWYESTLSDVTLWLLISHLHSIRWMGMVKKAKCESKYLKTELKSGMMPKMRGGPCSSDCKANEDKKKTHHEF